MRAPRFLTENLGLKLFSLSLALVIFLAVRNEQVHSTTVAVRLLVKETAALVNTADLPPELLVKISAPWWTLQRFDDGKMLPVELDLTGLPRGTSSVRIVEQQLDLPSEAEVISISPSILTVRLETREKRKVPVKVVLRGEPAAGFELGKALVEPAEVEIDGPRREVREVKSVRAVPVDVAGATEPVIAAAALEPPAAHTRVVGHGRVNVKVPVEPVPDDPAPIRIR